MVSVEQNSGAQALRDCPICGGGETTDSPFSTERWNVGQCTGCGMVYLRNPPPQEALKSDLAWEETRKKERAKRRKDREIYYFFSDAAKRLRGFLRRGKRKEVELVNRLRPEGGRVLDIGCAEGGTLKALDDGRWTLFGIEPSPNLARKADEVCRASGGHAAPHTALDGLPQFGTDFFDVVIMRSFLEHDCHAVETLQEVHKVLKAGGVAVVKVPNAACWNARLRGPGWPGVRHPDHVNYFTPPHLERMLLDSGFTTLKFPLLWRLPSSDNMWLVAS